MSLWKSCADVLLEKKKGTILFHYSHGVFRLWRGLSRQIYLFLQKEHLPYKSLSSYSTFHPLYIL